MKSIKVFLILIIFSIAINAQEKENKHPVEDSSLTITLSDNSTVKGEIVRIENIDKDKVSFVSIILRNADMITGNPDFKEFKIDSLIGVKNIPVSKIKTINSNHYNEDFFTGIKW